MSRTQRNFPDWKRFYYRRPKTTNEIRQNQGLLSDIKVDDVQFNISGINRLHRHIPTAWDDVVISSYYEVKPYLN